MVDAQQRPAGGRLHRGHPAELLEALLHKVCGYVGRLAEFRDLHIYGTNAERAKSLRTVTCPKKTHPHTLTGRILW